MKMKIILGTLGVFILTGCATVLDTMKNGLDSTKTKICSITLTNTHDFPVELYLWLEPAHVLKYGAPIEPHMAVVADIPVDEKADDVEIFWRMHFVDPETKETCRRQGKENIVLHSNLLAVNF